MAASDVPQRRVERKALTRQKLIDAAVDIVRSEGVEALSTGRLAEAAGITQPGFYVHFENLEDCLRATAERVVTAMQQAQSDARRRVFDRISRPDDVARGDLIFESFEVTLDMFLSEPRFSELFLAYRRHQGSAFGRAMAQTMAVTRGEMAEDLWSVGRRLGLPAEARPHMDLVAELVLAIFLAGAEAILDGRATDRQVVVASLARMTRGALLAEFDATMSTATRDRTPGITR